VGTNQLLRLAAPIRERPCWHHADLLAALLQSRPEGFHGQLWEALVLPRWARVDIVPHYTLTIFPWVTSPATHMSSIVKETPSTIPVQMPALNAFSEKTLWFSAV
jgi:hypothetical protein